MSAATGPAPQTEPAAPAAPAAPGSDPRADLWQARFRLPIIVAALAVLPLVALSLSSPHGVWHTVEIAGHWAVWLTFAVEVAVMLSVVRDRRAWIAGHRLELLVVAVSSPLIPLALAAAPALRLLVVAKTFKTLKLAKAIKLAKLGKSVRLLRRRLGLGAIASLALGLVALALAAATVVYMLTGEVPWRGDARTIMLVVAGALATYGVNHLRRESTVGRSDAGGG